MKKILLTVLLFVFVGLSAQNLSLNELISLRKMSLPEAEMYLSKKGWRYSEGESDDKVISAEFIFNSNGSPSIGEAFLALMYGNTQKVLGMQFVSSKSYNEYLSTLQELNIKLVSSGIDESGALMKEYKGATTTFLLRTSKMKKGSIVSYYITIKGNR